MKIKEAAKAEQLAEAARTNREQLDRIRGKLRERNLAICVGSGVTLYSTAEGLDRPKPLERLKWKGLISNGLNRVINARQLDPDTLPVEIIRAMEDLETEDSDPKNASKRVIRAATTVRDLLNEKGLFSTWLVETFESLPSKITRPGILEALKKLRENGAMLLTTNYDGLLEYFCGIPAIDASRKEDLILYERKERSGVWHPHGYYEHAEHIVLDAFDYYKVRQNTDVQEALRRFLKSKTILFVGCGSGLEDPNMGPLLKWIGEQEDSVRLNHYILLQKKEATVEGPLIKIYYDDYEHDQIAPWLEKLLGDENVAAEGTRK